ncbi:hypothetical protein HUU42_15795 [bacterium]|nr:hypothetical protein [bacterium]
MTAIEKRWINILKQEFKTELAMLSSDNYDDIAIDSRITLGIRSYRQDTDNEIDGALFPEISYSMRHFSAAGRGRIDNGILSDTTYSGRKTKYFAARLEEAYGLWQLGKMNLMIGRFGECWSPFFNRSLIVSNNPYTYEKINFSFQTKHISFKSLFSKLDNLQNAVRYFSAHRLDIKLNNGMNFGISESVVYGGVNQPVEWVYLNPFNIFAASQLNDKKEANESVALDFFMPFKKINLRGQILIDDFILDGPDKPAPNRKTSSDRLGFLFGVQLNRIGIGESQISMTYERVGSYTYNVKQKRPWQAYTYHERGLGSSKNDHDLWTINYQFFGIPKFIMALELFFDRQGQRTLQSNDFEDSTFVKLPFPSGLVQKKIGCFVSTFYQPTTTLSADLILGFNSFRQYKHLSKNKFFFVGSIGFNWIIQYSREIK